MEEKEYVEMWKIKNYDCNLCMKFDFFIKNSDKLNYFKSKLHDDILFVLRNLKEEEITCIFKFDKYMAYFFCYKPENTVYVDDILLIEDVVTKPDHPHYLSPFMKNTNLFVYSYVDEKYILN